MGGAYWRVPARSSGRASVQGRGEGVRAARRVHRRLGAHHHALLVLDRAPVDDGHALRCAALGTMGLTLLAFHTAPEEESSRLRSSPSGAGSCASRLWHLFGAIVLLVLPQVLYLLSRNLTPHLTGSRGFRWHLDPILLGLEAVALQAAGQRMQNQLPINRRSNHGTRRCSGPAWRRCCSGSTAASGGSTRLYFLAAWVFVALATMGQGRPGLVLPIAIIAAYVAATRRWRDLERVEALSRRKRSWPALRCLGPTVQMYLRHGQPFTDRLLFHDMYKRAFVRATHQRRRRRELPLLHLAARIRAVS